MRRNKSSTLRLGSGIYRLVRINDGWPDFDDF
jgi:hypothetical protein